MTTPAPDAGPDRADPMSRLLAIMARLRDPTSGCAWDLEQSFETIAPYTIEEAYEVADAIERKDLADLRLELGDLLFQVVFHARMAEEAGAFGFEDVVEAICEKMIRRHPHVFGEAEARTADEQTRAWEDIKARERAGKDRAASVLSDVPTALPALLRALKLSRRAARVGFTWTRLEDVLAKLDEELGELRAEAEAEARDPDRLEDEMGDVLFVCANIARMLDVDPEAALRRANAKFVRRFSAVEAALRAQGRSPEAASLEEMDALWNAAKSTERAERADGAGSRDSAPGSAS